MATVFEPARQLPVFGAFDGVVIGGGPAGLAASTSAATRGAKVLLAERYGFLGGMGTAGGVTNFAGLYGRRNGVMRSVVRGAADELLERMESLGGLPRNEQSAQGRAYNDLPWRMLVPPNVDNLLVAGRCASMTHEGQSAARASGACYVMGQAAGTAAPMQASDQRFADINVPALQTALTADGVYLDHENT